MQFTPSTLLYSQALALLTQLDANYASNTLKSPSDIARQLTSILTQFDKSYGQPLVDFQRFEDGEPPTSSKINSILGYIQLDINVLQNQVDILRASTIFANNVVSTNLLNASDANAALANKLDTLELYSSSSTSGNMVVFSDSFGSSQLTDFAFLNASEQASMKDGFLTLSPEGDLVNLTEQAKVSILDTSNGIIGNNQEIEDPNSVYETNTISNTPMYKFIAETLPANKIESIIDGDPTTWVEYEYYLVSDSDKATARNYNFQYRLDSTVGQSNLIDWAIGPPNGVLKLDLQLDLGAIKPFNYINYSDFGLANNTNNPVLISSISTSPDGTIWTNVGPDKVSVGTNTNSSSLRAAANYTLGTATWSFDMQSARYVNFEIEQANPIEVNVGHLYYEGIDIATPNSSVQRVLGPIPTLSNISFIYNPSNVATTNYTQYREYFKGKRWAIGINDISIQQINYKTENSLVTKELKVGGVVNRIALDADVVIPSSFDSSQSWVTFYVSPDNGQNWFPINNIEDSGLNIPSIISFNDPLPLALQDPRVSYQQVPEVVTSLRFKIELASPNHTETPLVRSYSLKVTTK